MLIYDIIHKLLDSLTERDLDLLVLILKSKLLKLMHAYLHVCTYYFSSLSSLSLQLVVWRSGGMIAWLSKYNVFSNNNDYSFIVGYYY